MFIVYGNCLFEEYLVIWRKIEMKRKNVWEVNIVFVSFVFYFVRLDDVFSLVLVLSLCYE